MTGGNAARVYGFDLGLLDPIAARVGPTVEEIAEPLTDIPPGRRALRSPKAGRCASGDRGSEILPG